MNTKQIHHDGTTVDLDTSRCIWGNYLVEIWGDAGNVHVWAETNGDPVYGDDDLCNLLAGEDCRISNDMIDQIIAADPMPTEADIDDAISG